jgi:predicted  nucleic acid-binding Zn-ribbon protein
MSQVRHLVQLQEIDSQIDQAKARLEEIDAALNDNSAMRKANARTEKAAKALTKAQLALRRAEQDVQAQQDKIDRNQKALYGGGKSPKELEDLQMESGALGRYLEKLEETQLEVMIAFEDAEAEDQAAKENLSAVKKEVAAENVDLSAEQESLEEKITRLNTQREAAAAPITPDLIADYEKLRQDRFGLAVTSVNDGGCAACGASLTAAQAQAARSPNKIAHCGVCGRIIHG